MVTLRISEKSLLKHDVKAYIFFIQENASCEGDLLEAQKIFFPGLSLLFKERGFTGKRSDFLVVPISKDKTIIHLICAGIGSPDSTGFIPIEQYRRAVGSVVNALMKHKCSTAAMKAPVAELFDVSSEYLAAQTCSIAGMASYRFDEFITDKQRKEDIEITIDVVTNNPDDALCGVAKSEVISSAVNTARYWVDLPPCNLTPVELADKAKRIAKAHGMNITVFDEQEVKQMGMGGLTAVSAGSDRDCQFVVMEYHADKNAPTLGFVGKGITFDAGGLSLKPSSAMETMKEDMAGAAAVISAMHAIAQLKAPVNVIACVPLAENLPSDKAVKPGDIITFYNGKTAEVKNTDAEGRLILADALAYAIKHFKLDALVDVATLTGSCQHALGPFFSGLFSNHDDLVDNIYDSSCSSGDRVWRLPLSEDYKLAIKSNVADISNTGSRQYLAGAITAAWFLAEFVGDVAWAHIDIAGTAFDVPDISYYGKGATGAPVRLLVDLAMNWKK